MAQRIMSTLNIHPSKHSSSKKKTNKQVEEFVRGKTTIEELHQPTLVLCDRIKAMWRV